MRKILALLVLTFAAPSSAQVLGWTSTVQVTSPRNALTTEVSYEIKLTPLNDALSPLLSLSQNWIAPDGIADVTTFTFPSSPTAYKLAGFQMEVFPKGTGFTTVQSLKVNNLLDSTKDVPAGLTVNAVVTFPRTELGSIVATLGPDAVPPTAPVLSATPGLTTVSVSWTPASDNVGAVNYLLERTIGTAGPFALIALTTSGPFIDSGLTSSTAYTYKVRAFDAAGAGRCARRTRTAPTCAGT